MTPFAQLKSKVKAIPRRIKRAVCARHVWDMYSTHQPVLYEAVRRTNGAVIEFGCGYGSTPLLHMLCKKNKRRLLSLESDRDWLDKFKKFETPWHEFIFVNDWEAILQDDRIIQEPFDVVFIDQSPWEARHSTLKALKDTAKFIVIHDCDYFPEHEIFGESLRKINGSKEPGERMYDDVFKSYKEFFPLLPWPYELTGPPTLLGSNFQDCQWNVNFQKYIFAINFK